MNTNSRTFRTKLSEFFNAAIKKPVSIIRGGDRFILLNEEEYLNLKDEVASLQRSLLAMLEIRDRKKTSISNPNEYFSKKFEETSAKIQKKHKAKKAAS